MFLHCRRLCLLDLEAKPFEIVADLPQGLQEQCHHSTKLERSKDKRSLVPCLLSCEPETTWKNPRSCCSTCSRSLKGRLVEAILLSMPGTGEVDEAAGCTAALHGNSLN